MAAGYEAVEEHTDDAFRVNLEHHALAKIRVIAPTEVNSPAIPGPWVPYSGDAVTSLDVEDLTGGMAVDWPSTGASDVDDLAANAADYGRYPAAALDCYPVSGTDRVYYMIPVTTYSPAGFDSVITDLPEPGPNQRGPELQTAGEFPATWQVRGRWYAYALLKDDPTALQLQNSVLKMALVPHELLEASPEEFSSYPGSQWTWQDWPTKSVLDSLTVIRTIPAPDLDDYLWDSSYPQWDRGTLDISFDLDIDPAWVVDGRVHFTYWFERTDSVDRLYSMDYTGSRTPTAESTWPAVDPADPIDSYCIDYSSNYFAGTWSKNVDGGLWLSNRDGGDAGPRTLFTFAASNGQLSGDRTFTWTWLSVDTDGFGVALTPTTAGGYLVVTPTQVLDSNPSGATVLATHSTPFATGDVCDVVVVGDTLSVLRNGVEVSSCGGGDGELTAVIFAPVFWAIDVNPDNRIAGVDAVGVPTSHGDTSLYAELSFTEEPSVFVSAPATAYRMLQLADYPVFHLERWYYSNELTPEWTCWLKLHGPADQYMVWFGYYNSQVGVIESPFDLPVQRGPTWNRCTRRMDGTLVMHDFGDYSTSYGDASWPWSFLPNGLIRNAGLDPVLGEDYALPGGSMPLTNAFSTYLRVSVGGDSTFGSWRDTDHADIALYAHKLEGTDYAPGVWHWQDGDDHDGLQDVGYAHSPVTPMPLGPPAAVNGFAMDIQSSIEEWVYAGRQGILGYNDDTGPFFYGWLNPGGMYGNIFEEDQILDYDHVQTDAEDGREVGRLEYGPDWISPRFGALTDELYPSESPRGDDYRLIYVGPFNQGVALHTLPGPGKYVDYWGLVQPQALNGIYTGEGYTAEWTGLFAVHLPAYPDSVFFAWFRSTPAGDAYGTALTVKELDKRTGAVLRELPGCRPEFLDRHWGDINYSMLYAQPSVDGTAIEWVQSYPTLIQYDLLSPYYTYSYSSYVTDYPAGGREDFLGDNATISIDAPDLDVWFRVTQTAAGNYGMHTSPFDMELYQGELCTGQVMVRCSAATTMRLDASFYATDRSLIETQSGTDTVLAAGDTALTETFIPPAGTAHMTLRLACTAGAASFAFRHPGLWRPGRPAGGRTHETLAAQPVKLYRYDPATDSVTTTVVENTSAELIGRTSDGLQLVIDYDDTPRLWDPATDTVTVMSLEDYYGKGFNGGFIGTDGRYLYYYQLNYHREPHAVVLTAADIAKIDPAAIGTYHYPTPGPLPVVGDTVGMGGGIAEAFNEFYRYDLSVLSIPPGPNQVVNGDASDGLTGWSLDASGGSVSIAPAYYGGADTMRLTSDGSYSMMLFSDQGTGNGGSYVGGAIPVTPGRNYRLSAQLAFIASDYGVGRPSLQVTMLDADGLYYSFDSYLDPSPDQGEIPREAGFTFFVPEGTAAVFVGLGIQTSFLMESTDYLEVTNIELRDVGGPIPIEFLFNTDCPYPQTYCVDPTPVYTTIGSDLYIAYWDSAAVGDGIAYDFCWWGWPQSFIPVQLGIPPLHFDRYLTDSTKPSHSDIGFTRYKRSSDNPADAGIGFGRMQRSIDT